MKWLNIMLAGVLLVGAPAIVRCAVAQVAVSPAAVELSLPAGQQGEVALAVTNVGATPRGLFAVPLPEEGMPEDVGEMLFHTQPGVIGDPYDLAMTSVGRLFVARYGGGDGYTWEFTPELDSLRLFEHPRADNTSSTPGLAWMPPEGHPEGTLWWMDVVSEDFTVEQAMLIEGDLDGNETGRIVVDVPVGPGAGIAGSGYPVGLSYDPETGLFFYLDLVNEDIYAIDADGQVVPGYPVPETDYDEGEPFSLGGTSFDAYGGYMEMAVALPGESRAMRVVVTDRWGRNTGVETPLTLLYSPDGQGEVIRVMGVLRSRLDPSVMYLTALTGTSGPPTGKWVFAIRAHPLPPRWLRVSPVAPHSLEIAPGETDTLTVRLDTEGMEPGVYAGQVALRDGGPNGEEVVSVPVTLTVTPGVDTEDDAEPEGASRLAVYPNPATASATVALTLETVADVKVAVYDVLGRRVALLAEGPLAIGTHRFTLDGSDLPAGIYLVRAESGERRLTERITLLR